MAYDEWKSIQSHIKNCDCENKNANKCGRSHCNMIFCDKFKDSYSWGQGVCFNCDTWCHPNPFNPINKDLLDLWKKTCDKCNKKLFEIKKEGNGIVDIFNTVHNCRVCGDCHSYIGHLFCEKCIMCLTPNNKQCPDCNSEIGCPWD